MTLPLATTTITVRDGSSTGDPTEDAGTGAVKASGVRAHFSAPSGRESLVGGQQTVTDMRLDCDPCALTSVDFVQDEQTGDVWDVIWVRLRNGLGLAHIEAGVNAVSGGAR